MVLIYLRFDKENTAKDTTIVEIFIIYTGFFLIYTIQGASYLYMLFML